MINIEWKEEYNIDIPEIDDQHKHLVEMINSLANDRDPRNIVDNVKKMAKYAEEHFELEEKLMLESGCQTLRQHKLQHMIFREKTSIFNNFDYTSGEHSLDALMYLSNWLVNHILTMDKAYKKYFQPGLE